MTNDTMRFGIRDMHARTDGRSSSRPSEPLVVSIDWRVLREQAYRLPSYRVTDVVYVPLGIA